MATIVSRATLITAINAFATFDQAGSVPYFVDWAHQEVCRRLRCKAMLTTSSAITVDAETETLPTRFAALKAFWLDTSPRRTLMVVSSDQAQASIAAYVSQTYPEWVAIEGSSFRFGPAFTGSASGYALYWQEPAALTDDADTNTVLTKYPLLYLWGALEALYRFMEDDVQADRYGGMFGALIEDINKRDAGDVMSGPLQVQNYGGRVV